MTQIIDELQARVAESKKNLDEVTKTFQTWQQAFSLAQQDHNVWTLALQAEIRNEQRKVAAATENQLTLSTANKPSAPIAAIAPETSIDNPDAFNKTDTVRDLLRQHPAGMSAIEIWKEVGAQFKYRPYLYSVLKRLRDRKEVVVRRNRYCLNVAPKVEGVGEVQEQPVVQ